ncbi:MAG: hypothetical protein KAQ85_07370 [Thermodesulfovibrionia bacterium]|nr:hypothetical protein [Thermodesulfovibrionia bacterium]
MSDYPAFGAKGKLVSKSETGMTAMIINDIVLIVHNVIYIHVILRQHPDY